MNAPKKIVVMGILGRTPVAGVAWQVLHYLDGFRRLGHEVYYLEDTKEWPYNHETGGNDCLYIVNYIDRLMRWTDLSDRWAFCDVSQGGRVYGLSESRLSQVLHEADAIVNLTGSTQLSDSDSYLRVPVRIYLETDPGVPQIEIAEGRQFTTDFLSAHTHHFTFGENLGNPDCGLPVGPFKYRPTRQPIVLDWWSQGAGADAGGRSNNHVRAFTTVATWQQKRDIVWNGETYSWSKDKQFEKFIDLPARSQETFELALACKDSSALDLLRARGWRVVDALPLTLTQDIFPYRSYITDSEGEFTAAKDQNIRLRTGWFSDRSACYLAAGRPVITQDTAFDSIFPTGEGLFSFSTMDDILAALDAVRSDYCRHSHAARSIAEEYFRAETVLSKLMEEVGL